MVFDMDLFLTVLLVVAAMATIMTPRVMWSALLLAVTSGILTIIMFRLNSPIAAVFELSVCAGLIPAILISTIGLTRRLTAEDLEARRKERLRRFWFLPVLVVLAGVILTQVHIPLDFTIPAPAKETDVRIVLWNLRHVDLLGQIVILLGGAFAVVVLLKDAKNE